VPWDITFSLSVFNKNTEDAYQILEQILPYFRPEFTTNINIIPEMGLVIDVPVVLQNLAIEDSYEGDFESRRTQVHTLDFTMKAFFYGPVSNKPVITRAIIDIHNGSVASNSGTLERITVTADGTVIDVEGFGFLDS
jgi:hypothetical protein